MLSGKLKNTICLLDPPLVQGRSASVHFPSSFQAGAVLAAVSESDPDDISIH